MQVFPVFLPHAGCRQQCLFCNQQTTTGQVELPAPDAVTAWLDTTLPAEGRGEIAYYGGTFSSLPDVQQGAFLQAARRFVEQGRVAGIRISTCPDALQGERSRHLAEQGVTTVEIGCQSFDDTVLVTNHRGHTVRDIHAAVASCRAAGLTFGLQLMPGLAGASPDESMQSLRAALALTPAFLRIYPTLVFKETGLAELWRCGDYQPLELDAAVDLVARQLLVCRAAGVPVIRMGLQASEGLAGAVLAGPWHPAFGQLVRSRLWRWALDRAAGTSRTVAVHSSDLSDALGHRRENLVWLQQQHGLERIRVDDTLPRDSFLVGTACHHLQETLLSGEQM